MENEKNRWFLKVESGEHMVGWYNIDANNDYKKNKKNYYRMLIRLPDELLEKFSEIEGFDRFKCNLNHYKVAKKKNDGSRNKTDEYDFDEKIIPFKNDEAREMVINHSVCIIKKEYEGLKEEFIQKIKDNFNTYKIGEKGDATTIQLAETPLIRGIWKPAEGSVDSSIVYPICVLSYKRANKYGYTHKTLTKMKIKHYLFIEPQDLKAYTKWFDNSYCDLIVADENLSEKNMGSTSMRNFILKWASREGFLRCWMLDDNINGYFRYWQGVKNRIETNEIFASIERYVDRYDNVGAVSHNFNPFICENDDRACIVKNGKCYSSMLLPTEKDIKFRYKHQEDNLISMEFIDNGYCNLCFNHILYNKDTSGTNLGGNREAIYKCKDKQTDGDGYKERFEYFEAILKVLYIEKKIKLKEGRTLKDLMKRSTTMKSKEYHAKIDYSALLNNDKNDVIKKLQYDYIIQGQKNIPLELNIC